jgi:hypothetical protein
MYNLIVHGVTVADLQISQQARLDRDWKFAMMGGADFHLVKILALVCCSFVRFFSCCGGPKKRCTRQKNNIGGNT